MLGQLLLLLFRRSRLEEVGGFGERLKCFQDWDFAIHLACMSSDSAEARRRFRQTLRIRPYSLTIWAYLLLSLFGGRAYRLVRAARRRHVSGMVHIPTS